MPGNGSQSSIVHCNQDYCTLTTDLILAPDYIAIWQVHLSISQSGIQSDPSATVHCAGGARNPSLSHKFCPKVKSKSCKWISQSCLFCFMSISMALTHSDNQTSS